MKHLRLRVQTARGPFGADVPLGAGLVVLRAENSRGKSTAVRCLLYVLGMERMITAQPSSAVTAAMRDHLIFDAGSKAETSVLESSVSLEISNQLGEVVTLTRWIKHATVSDKLIRVTFGPAVTAPDSYSSDDFYVGRAGSALNPKGFHRWLASFIGWEMPNLPARDGRIAPLYMEQVWPLLFVEQRRGWGGIQAQMPYFSGVADVRRKAIEFLLDLEVGRRELERQQLLSRMRELETEWKAAVQAFNRHLSGDGVAAAGLTQDLSFLWPPTQPAFLLKSVDDRWVPLEEVLSSLRAGEREASNVAVSSVGAMAGREERQLQEVVERVDQLQDVGSYLREEIIRDRAELASVNAKLEALREDQRQYQDIVVLEGLGSSSGSLSRLDSDCPVCHRILPSSLLGAAIAAETMSTDDSLAYIKQQIQLFEAMARDSQKALSAKMERWASLRQASVEARSEIRRLRTDLTQRNDAPSVEQIATQFLRQQQIQKLEAISEDFRGLQGELMRLAGVAAHTRSELDAIPAAGLTDTDERKLSLLEESFTSQLRDYDFGSFSNERLAISREDYLPRRDAFDLQADISASDAIRVVWAYLIGLMEVSETVATNHPRFLVFDEPRQQSTKEVSFRALLRRASRLARNGQVLFATSEDMGSLTDMLRGIDCRLHVIDGYLLQPL